jgi:hypothetical protein
MTSKRTLSKTLVPFSEPRLRFGYQQAIEDPKDGLLLFGPAELASGLQYGVIGTPEGLRQFDTWVGCVQKGIGADPDVTSSIAFPGFEAIFRTPLPPKARVQLTIDPATLGNTVKISDSYQRVFDTVDLFAGPIRRFVKEEDPKIALWFVVIPEEVWKLCRPHSTLSKREVVLAEHHMSHAKAMELLQAPELFEETNLAAEKHLYENHFHNQLKAKLLECEAVTQIVRQTTIAPREFLNARGKPIRKLQDDATVAWNLSTAIYYKAGAKPWSLADIRDGVC